MVDKEPLTSVQYQQNLLVRRFYLGSNIESFYCGPYNSPYHQSCKFFSFGSNSLASSQLDQADASIECQMKPLNAIRDKTWMISAAAQPSVCSSLGFDAFHEFE